VLPLESRRARSRVGEFRKVERGSGLQQDRDDKTRGEDEYMYSRTRSRNEKAKVVEEREREASTA